MNSIVRCLKKDLLMEFRSKTAFSISFTFSAITTLAISLITSQIKLDENIHSILLWIIIFFSAMNGLSHIFTREEEEGTSLFLMLNHKPESVYLSKLIFNLIYFIILSSIICTMYLFFLQISPSNIHFFIISVFSGSTAIVSITTILGAMVSKAGGKGSLLTAVTFPLLLPVLWTSIKMTESSFKTDVAPYLGNAVFLLAFSGLVICLSYLLFRFIWMEV